MSLKKTYFSTFFWEFNKDSMISICNSLPAADNKEGLLSPGNINILKANLLHQACLIRLGFADGRNKSIVSDWYRYFNRKWRSFQSGTKHLINKIFRRLPYTLGVELLIYQSTQIHTQCTLSVLRHFKTRNFMLNPLNLGVKAPGSHVVSIHQHPPRLQGLENCAKDVGVLWPRP